MNWSHKFAFDEFEEMLANRPWLLVGDDFSSADHSKFIEMQNRFMLDRGWEWFKNTLRGRLFPNLKLTTITTFNGERDPSVGDPGPDLIAKVEQKFPGFSIVSLIGSPHVVSGPSVSMDVLDRLRILAHSQHWRLEKKAMKETNFNTPYYKDEFQFEIADVDRYATDRYFANVTLQETDNLYSIGFQMYNYQVGLTGAVQYWHYEKNEFDRAKKTFNEIKSVLKETMTDIEYHRPPMAVITPMVRSALQPIDIGRKERSGNYFHNWFKELAKEPDWRTTLYGNRYPKPVVQYIDAFWNVDDAGKEITIEGTSSRSRVLRYKPSHGTTSKYAADNNRLRQLLSDAWKIPASIGTGGVLAWLLSLGIPPAQLEQQLQNGATPQQIITQVAPKKSPIEPGLDQKSTLNPPADPSNADLTENKANSVEEVDNGPKTTKIQHEVDMRNLNGLDQMFAEKVKLILLKLAQKGWQPRVAEGLRSKEQQQEKIDQGHSSLKDPSASKHVQGIAVDIIDSRYGWGGPASDLNFKFWNDLGQAAKEVGLVWGGDWRTFKDVAHVERGASIEGSSAVTYRHASWSHAYAGRETG